MNDWSTPMEADLAEACPVQWLPPTGGRVRMRNRKTGEIWGGESGGQYAVMGQPLKGEALAFSLKAAWREADRVARLQDEIVPDGHDAVAGQVWDTWIEPLGWDRRTCWAVSTEERQGPPPGPWMFPGVGRVMGLSYKDGKKVAGPDELCGPLVSGGTLVDAFLIHLEGSKEAMRKRGETVHIWIEAVLTWTKRAAKDVPGIGYPVPFDHNAPLHELGTPIDPMRAVEEQQGGCTHPILGYRGIKFNLEELGL